MDMIEQSTLPISPPGYQPPIPFTYPKGLLQLLGIAIILAVTPLLIYLTWRLQGNSTEWLTLFNVRHIPLMFVTILLTIIIHELIHGMTYKLLGYQVRYGVSLHLAAAYAGAFGQWQQRHHNIMVALAPLIVMTLILIPLLAASTQSIVLIAFTALLFNSSGAVGDLYLTWRLLRLPPTTLLYDVDTKTMLLFLPNGKNRTATHP